MRRRSIENARRVGAEGIGHGDRFLGGIVGQAEHDEVDVGHHRFARGLILAQRRVDALHLDAGNARQPLADLEPGRSGLAVDEDLRLLAHGGLLLWQQSAAVGAA